MSDKGSISPMRKEQLNLLESFFNNSHDGIYIVSKTGEVLMANPSIIKMLGASYEEVVGINLNRILETGVYQGSPAMKVLETGALSTGLVKARNGTEIMSTSKPVYDDR